ncbi:MAG: hypothetical protein JXJ04_13065 [Spirochaetales bacterium]|nr:hypothetical protein [Spirochaetales bacterium]
MAEKLCRAGANALYEQEVKDHLQSRWLFPNQKNVEGKAFKTMKYW